MLDPAAEKVWQKAKHAGEKNEANGFRKDQCEAWIKKQDFGNRKSDYGWEIDHIVPVSHKGSDDLSNLRPLHWRNNASRQDNRLVCVVKSDGSKNLAASSP